MLGDREQAFWGAGCYVRCRVTASAASQLQEDAADAGAELGLAFVCVFWGCCSSSLPLSSAFRSSAAKRQQPPLAWHPSGCGDHTRAGPREPLTRGTRCPRSSRRGGKPWRGAGTSGGAGSALGTGPLFTKPGKMRVRVRQPNSSAAAPAPLPSPPPSPRRRQSIARAGRGGVGGSGCWCRAPASLPSRFPVPPSFAARCSRSPGPGSGGCGRSESVEGFKNEPRQDSPNHVPIAGDFVPSPLGIDFCSGRNLFICI